MPHANSNLERALKAILADPYGCVFCDSGVLRNEAKPHAPGCGFALAKAAMSDDATSDEEKFDHAWQIVMASDELKFARQRLSIHELRHIIRAVAEAFR